MAIVRSGPKAGKQAQRIEPMFPRRGKDRCLVDQPVSGQWERLEAERKANLALRKAHLALRRKAKSLSAADFR